MIKITARLLTVFLIILLVSVFSKEARADCRTSGCANFCQLCSGGRAVCDGVCNEDRQSWWCGEEGNNCDTECVANRCEGYNGNYSCHCDGSPTPPTETPTPAVNNPKGYFDLLNCNVVTGWACDPDDWDAKIEVEFYEGTTKLGSVIADDAGETAVAEQCGGKSAHRFSNIPISEVMPQLLDGASHTVRAIAVNVGSGSDTELSDSPRTKDCSCKIQGYKLLMPGNVISDTASVQTITCGGFAPVTSNPYYFLNKAPGDYTCSTSTPDGFWAGYSLCTSSTECHGKLTGYSDAVSLSCPAEGYSDLYWHYTPLGKCEAWCAADKHCGKVSGEQLTCTYASCADEDSSDGDVCNPSTPTPTPTPPTPTPTITPAPTCEWICTSWDTKCENLSNGICGEGKKKCDKCINRCSSETSKDCTQAKPDQQFADCNVSCKYPSVPCEISVGYTSTTDKCPSVGVNSQGLTFGPFKSICPDY